MKRVTRFSDGPTDEFRRKHRVEVVVADNDLLHQRVTDAVVIEMLFRAGTLTDEQLYTGQRLYADWYFSVFSGIPIHLKSETRPPKWVLSDAEEKKKAAQLDATERYKHGLALLPMRMECVVTGVCIENRTIKDATRRAGYRRQATGTEVLQDGLDRLGQFYAELYARA